MKKDDDEKPEFRRDATYWKEFFRQQGYGGPSVASFQAPKRFSGGGGPRTSAPKRKGVMK
jgi:hypothetical protein